MGDMNNAKKEFTNEERSLLKFQKKQQHGQVVLVLLLLLVVVLSCIRIRVVVLYCFCLEYSAFDGMMMMILGRITAR
jgi:hypothetical protein